MRHTGNVKQTPSKIGNVKKKVDMSQDLNNLIDADESLSIVGSLTGFFNYFRHFDNV